MRVRFGVICLSSSSHLPLKLNSRFMNPVALPPGRARPSTSPFPTGSPAMGITIGTVRVLCSSALTAVDPWATTTSGTRATNSAACLRMSSPLAVAQRVSIFTLLPMVQPDSALACRQKRPDAGLKCQIVGSCSEKQPNQALAFALRARYRSGHVPRRPRAA